MDLDEERPLEPLGEDEPLGPEVLRDEDRILIILSYMGPLAIVAMAAGRTAFVKWHARQGLLLGALVLLTFILLRPFHTLFYFIWPFLGEIFLTLEILTGFSFFIVAVLCLVRG